MNTLPLHGRAVELHQQELRAEAARDRQAAKVIAGTRNRGGIFLTLRSPRPEREQPQPWLARPRPTTA